MAATVRMLLTLLLVAKASCGLLPVDLSGISPGALLHLGLDTPSGGLLGGLGEILSSGVGTVGSLGQGVLGKVTALTLQHESDPSDIINVEPWKQDLSYPAYWLDTHKNGLDQSKQPGNQPSNNGIYVLPTTSNLVNQDFNRVPQVPTVYVDNQGRRYYIIQTNNNIVNEPVQPIKVTTPPTTQGNNQIYVIMNINGQQVLVPASRLPNNGLQMDINVKPNPATPGQMYVYVPSNNGENNVVTNAPVTNPVVNYVTTPKYISFEKEPVTEQNDTETSEVTESVSMEVPSDIENTKEESEGKDTDGIVESIGDDDIRK
ncbi:uncharacterized protein LOC115448931 isoform X3 [Manduca sexta]|uniref:uncharacterized protein LOC115448931 isoform X3 n=1 Tax=Manduca sexta TaxID=7130 RepID=UPI00188FFE89|nr:uncharacterized protein LOC115448931 isoform X3 [Manduca sexta]